MQHDHVLKELYFDLLTPPPKCVQEVEHRPLIKNHFSYLLYLCLHATFQYKILTTAWVIAKFKYLTFYPT